RCWGASSRRTRWAGRPSSTSWKTPPTAASPGRAAPTWKRTPPSTASTSPTWRGSRRLLPRGHQDLDLALVGLQADEGVGGLVQADDACDDLVVAGAALGEVFQRPGEFGLRIAEHEAQLDLLGDVDQGLDAVALHADAGHHDARPRRRGLGQLLDDARHADALEHHGALHLLAHRLGDQPLGAGGGYAELGPGRVR